MRIATADIGTNTALLLIADVDGGTVTPIFQEQRIVRLGKGVDAQRRLHPDSIHRTATAIAEYAQITRSHNALPLYATATSAARDASNRDEFLAEIAKIGGVELRVLTGDEEALWSYRGALSNRPELTEASVLDIGGGSTELIVGKNNVIHFRQSIDAGSVRFTERYFPNLPPTALEWARCQAAVDAAVAAYDLKWLPDAPFLGTAGTVTSLAAVDLGLTEYDAAAVDGHRVPYLRVVYWADRLLTLSESQILALAPGVLAGRADVFPAGVRILEAVMRRYSVPDLWVSDRGLRFGWALAVSER